MSRTYVSKELRERVAAQAKYRCGYCLTTEENIGIPMEIEHILPESLGGPTEEDNLWLACAQCNAHKNDRITALDPLHGQIVDLFNPRHQLWNEHFAWTSEKDIIIGLTATGRTTVQALQLNQPSMVRARRRWASVGWHPPKD